MALIDIDLIDYLDEIGDKALLRELRRRVDRGDISEAALIDSVAHPWTKAGMAADIRAAFYARDASRLEHLLVRLEQWEEAE